MSARYKPLVRELIYSPHNIPVEDLGYSQLAPSFPQANSSSGGMGQDVSSNGLLGVSLEPLTQNTNNGPLVIF